MLDIQTETDVASILNSYAARQPDNKHFRLWEVAGTAHADAHLVGPNVKYIDCGVPVNNGPMHIVAKAALRALTTWLTTGTAPVTAPRIDVTPGAHTDGPSQRRRDRARAVSGRRRSTCPSRRCRARPGRTRRRSACCSVRRSRSPRPGSPQLYPSRADYLRRYTGRRRRDDQGRLRAPRGSRRAARVRRTVPHSRLSVQIIRPALGQGRKVPGIVT